MAVREPQAAAPLVVNDAKSSPDAKVRAAGGIVWRPAPDRGQRRWRRPTPEVLLIHRPRYDDWSFPKGKLDDGEADEEAALREVHEETGLQCQLGAPLGETSYDDRRGRRKVVRYWLMEPDDADHPDPVVPNREVDEIRWLAPETAARLLTYLHDRELLDRLPRLPPRGHRRL
jgi:8-oxo-dGTP pyrophosphatase MutT (NUDIX family)